MRELTFGQKVSLTLISNVSVFITVFLNQMIITVFPSYSSVKLNDTDQNGFNVTSTRNCTIADPSNSYVAILIGCKYCTEMVMFPVAGILVDRFHPPLILFFGLLTELIACIVYSSTGNFYGTIVGRVVDGLGNTVVSTSGMTIIYMIYLRDRPRNRLITIESTIAYVSACVSPFAAGYVFEYLSDRSEMAARVATFMMLGPVFLACSVLIIPFAFEGLGLFVSQRIDGEKDPDQSKDLVDFIPVVIDPKIEEKKVDSIVDIHSSVSLYVLLRDKEIMIIVLFLTLNSLVYNSLETTLPIFMIRKFCSDQKDQGIVWLFCILSLAGFFLATFLYHMRPSICWVLPLVGVLANGVFCMSLSYIQPWWVIGVVLGFISFYSSMTEVTLIPMVPKIIDKRYPKSGYGRSSSLTLITFTISGIIGTFPAGALVDTFGFLALCSVLCLCAVFVAPFVFFLWPFFNTSS